MSKIKYGTTRNGEYAEFPLTNQLIILPNGAEYYLRYDPANEGLVITQVYGSKDNNSMIIQPMVSNQILIK